MNKQKDFISLEQALEQFFSAPVPRKEFLENLEQSLYAEPKMRIHPFPQITSPDIFPTCLCVPRGQCHPDHYALGRWSDECIRRASGANSLYSWLWSGR